MSLNLSRENIVTDAEGEARPVCNACASLITSELQFQLASCGHTFHKTCLASCAKMRPYCPVCNARLHGDGQGVGSAGVKTRSQKKNTGNQASNEQGNEQASTSAAVGNGGAATDSSTAVNPDALKEMVTSVVSAQQSQLFSSLSDQMSKLIQTNIEVSLSRLNLNARPNTPSTSHVHPQYTPPSQGRIVPPPRMQTLPAVENQTFQQIFGLSLGSSDPNNVQNPINSGPMNSAATGAAFTHSSLSDLASRPDKVLHIIANWRLKFSGNFNSLSVESFIYRVEALTIQTLQGDYDLLCRNASSLFEGKAADWFWRYHRSVSSVSWRDLCRALRQQYGDSRTDVDIRELIRDRKQKNGENFDSFFESVVELTDRLKQPLSDDTLVEILRRNLLPEIQHEILNVRIHSIQELRDICRRREFFMQDIRRKHGSSFSKPTTMPRRISELGNDCVEDNFSTQFEEEGEAVSAISLCCWNCQKPGHRYQDCLADRTIFCYGCGTPDTYKPSCKKCNSKNGRPSALKSAQRQTELD